MVLELKVPHENGLAGLRAILPTLAIYALSFAFTGIYWLNHHHLVHRTEEADTSILYANLVFLFFLSLLPFFTSYVLDKDLDSFSVALYAVSMLITGFGFLLLRLAIGRRLKQAGHVEPEDIAAQRKHFLSLVLYGIAIPLAFYHSHIALGVVALVTLVWIYPTAAIPLHAEQPPEHRGL
jgi:uncharacterized membrane protein